jgi:hypothetical protein
MRDPRLLLGVSVSILVSCSGGGAGYPDKGGVVAAQAGWCDSLAKLNGAGAKWEHLGACKGAYPAASAPYLKLMSKCFTTRREAAGEKAPDATTTVAECNDEVAVKMPMSDSPSAEAIDARCERASRCEKVPIPECVAAVKKLDTAQRSMLFGIYNQSALHDISDCLKSSSCGADEDAAREACYKKQSEKLLWFPG